MQCGLKAAVCVRLAPPLPGILQNLGAVSPYARVSLFPFPGLLEGRGCVLKNTGGWKMHTAFLYSCSKSVKFHSSIIWPSTAAQQRHDHGETGSRTVWELFRTLDCSAAVYIQAIVTRALTWTPFLHSTFHSALQLKNLEDINIPPEWDVKNILAALGGTRRLGPHGEKGKHKELTIEEWNGVMGPQHDRWLPLCSTYGQMVAALFLISLCVFLSLSACCANQTACSWGFVVYSSQWLTSHAANMEPQQREKHASIWVESFCSEVLVLLGIKKILATFVELHGDRELEGAQKRHVDSIISRSSATFHQDCLE